MSEVVDLVVSDTGSDGMSGLKTSPPFSEDDSMEGSTSAASDTDVASSNVEHLSELTIKKPKGQMTFADFNGFTLVKPNSKSTVQTKINNIDSTPYKKHKTMGINQFFKNEEFAELQSSDTSLTEDTKRKAVTPLESGHNKAVKNVPHIKVPNLKVLQSMNWSPNVPLLNDDFREFDIKLNDLWNANFCTKPKAHAGDIIKLMTFINKFDKYFDDCLRSLTYSTIETGLGLETDRDDRDDDDELDIKELKVKQDQMNLLFFSLLKLLFSTVDKDKNYIIATLKKFKVTKYPYGKMVGKIRRYENEYGSPKEWRVNMPSKTDITKPKETTTLIETENEELVDPNMKEIQTSTSQSWYTHEPLEKENHPLFSISHSELDGYGLFSMNEPNDRIITLRYLVDLNLAYSVVIHDEVYHMTHLNKNQYFTTLVPNFMKDGFEKTIVNFTTLCESIKVYIDAKRSKRYERFKDKFPILNQIKHALRTGPLINTKERRDVILSIFDKWTLLLEGIIPDNPLANPYEEESSKLRLQEFFINRVTHIGDFYIPTMHTYNNEGTDTNFYTDLRSLIDLFKKYENDEIDNNQIFSEFDKLIRFDFCLLYRNTAKIMSDSMPEYLQASKHYWYELGNDSASLDKFIKAVENILSGKDQNEVALFLADDKYQDTRDSLDILIDYLKRVYSVIKKFETLKSNYADGVNSNRRSMRTTGKKVNYKLQNDSELNSDVDEKANNSSDSQIYDIAENNDSNDESEYDDEIEETPDVHKEEGVSGGELVNTDNSDILRKDNKSRSERLLSRRDRKQ